MKGRGGLGVKTVQLTEATDQAPQQPLPQYTPPAAGSAPAQPKQTK